MTDPRTILVTGSTDGIGLETAKALAEKGHRILVHGRSAEKLNDAAATLTGAVGVETYQADLSRLEDVEALSTELAGTHDRLDVVINNAGVYHAHETRTANGLDVRFAVNTIAPYLLTRRLLPLIGPAGRVVNLSSAAQAPVDLAALRGEGRLSDGNAYAQSKLALTMWTNALATELGEGGPVIVSVNPGSLLATKMVREAFGTRGNDINIGVDILMRAALSEEFANASGRYFDNDARSFGSPHPDATDPKKCKAVMQSIDSILEAA